MGSFGSRAASPLLVAASVSLASTALADPVPSPAESAAQQASEATPSSTTPVPAETPSPAYPVHTWALPAIDVAGEAKPELAEDDRIGDYAQPRWSAHRRFPTTRLYVMPKGKVETEYWLRYTAPLRDTGGEREVRSYYELGFGLGRRFQADIYLMTQQNGYGPIALAREMLELRYALADWGKLWGNPTLYLEYQRRSGGNDWLEGKVLLGGELAPRWHGGVNAVVERELGGASENEYNLTTGVSYTAIDDTLHLGLEGYAEVHDVAGDRLSWGKGEQLFLGGPSVMVSPLPPLHLLVSPLFGVGKAGEGASLEAMFRLWFVTGWAF
jgi:hypothetical protein